MNVVPKPRALDWFALADAGLHPTKRCVLETIAERGNRPMSPNDLSVLLGVPLGSVSYHVRELADEKMALIELHHTEPRRGALQHFYVVTARALLSPRQRARRALTRSASKMAGAPVELTGETLARAYYEALWRRARVFEDGDSRWDDLSAEERKLACAAMDDLLQGVAGA